MATTTFIRSQIRQAATEGYRRGLVLGPFSIKQTCGFQHTLNRLLASPRVPDPRAVSFAGLAIASYQADKGFSRSDAADGWTRDLTLSIPIARGFRPAVALLVEALTFLTGDHWHIRTRNEPVGLGARGMEPDFHPEAVCLFSGGTDSLVGAINLLEAGTHVLLVSHFESGADAGIQARLAAALADRYGANHVRHRAIQVNSPDAQEPSTRSRSLMFIGLALHAASAFGDAIPVYIPENGFVGINPPLTGSRLGSYSTRTTHPAFISKLQESLARVALGHQIFNPIAALSKGGVLAGCQNSDLLRSLLPLTVSCAKSGAVRFQGYPPGSNCGACFPCLVRRAGLHAIDMDRPGDYVHDAIGTSNCLSQEDRGRDLRSLLLAVNRFSRSDRNILLSVLKSGSLAAMGDPESALRTVRSGLEELQHLIDDKGCDEVLEYVSS